VAARPSVFIVADNILQGLDNLIANFIDDEGQDRMREIIQENYERIKSETSQIVNDEIERIKRDPILCKLFG